MHSASECKLGAYLRMAMRMMMFAACKWRDEDELDVGA